MVNEITTKVFNSERNISVKNVTQPEDDGKIRVISTFKADKSIVDAVKKSEENLKLTQFQKSKWIPFQVCQNSGPEHKKPSKHFEKTSFVQGSKRGCEVQRKKLQNMRNVDHR